MEEYRNNSLKSKTPVKEEPEKKEKVITGSAKIVKKSAWDKFGINLKNALGKVWGEIIVPAAKKSLSDGINNVSDMMIYGENRPRSSSVSTGRTVSYRSYYENKDRRDSYVSRPSRVGACDYDDIVLETAGEADAVLNRMDECIKRYDYVKVADLYDFVGLSASYTDNNYGWDENTFRSARYERVRDGYILRLPRPMPIE